MPRRSIGYGWVVVWTIAVMLMVSAGARLLFGVVLVRMEDHFGASRSAVTGVILVNMIAVSVLQPVVGVLGDRLGPKRLLVGGSLLIAVVLFPFSFATTVWQAYLLYGLLGAVGFAAVSPVNVAALVNRWFVERRGAALAVATSGTAFGQLLIVPLATWTLVRTDWQTTYRLLALLLAVAVVPLGALLLRERSAGAGGDASAPASAASISGATLQDALGAPEFWALGYGFLVCGFTMAFANTHFMAFADDMGMAPMAAADVVVVTAFFSIVGAVALGVLADRRRRSDVLALTYALRGVAFLLLFALPVGNLTFVYAIVLGISWTATTPLTAAIAADRWGHARLGAIFGTMFTGMHLGFGIGSWLDGVMYDLAGHYHGALVVNGLLGLSAAVVAGLVRSPRPGARRPRARPASPAVGQALAGD